MTEYEVVMGTTTNIAFAHSTWNPWIGCTKVHTGCANCYAECSTPARAFGIQWGDSGQRVMTSVSNWRKPIAWNREATIEGRRRRVFVSLCDPFEDWRGPMHVIGRSEEGGMSQLWYGRRANRRDGILTAGEMLMKDKCPAMKAVVADGYRSATMGDVRSQFFRLIRDTPNIDWMLFTKRPQNILRQWPLVSDGTDSGESDEIVYDNVWLLYSASDQQTLETGLAALLRCRGLVPILGLSLEPLLGQVTIGDVYPGGLPCVGDGPYVPGIDWVIAGGESGSKSRSCDIMWLHKLMVECAESGVPFFMKQLGDRPVFGTSDIVNSDRKGGNPSAWNESFRVRQFPKPRN